MRDMLYQLSYELKDKARGEKQRLVKGRKSSRREVIAERGREKQRLVKGRKSSRREVICSTSKATSIKIRPEEKSNVLESEERVV